MRVLILSFLLVIPCFGNDLEDLPLLPGLKAVHQFSSHNKEGMNGDSRWRLHDDEHGDAVLFDVMGPGCIRSMWATDIKEGAVLNFYFDGEEKPRHEIPMLDFFQGKHPLFPGPLNSYEERGRWGEKPFAGNSFTPIPFQRGLKISVSGKFEFYHILFDRYAHGTEVKTFDGEEDRKDLLNAFEKMGEAPYPITEAEVMSVETENLDDPLVLEMKRPGCIRQLVIKGEATEALLRDVWIEIRFDGHLYQDVRAPLGFFFGTAVHPAKMRTLALRSEVLEEGLRLTSWFPMPFWNRAEVRIVNRSGGGVGSIKAAISVCPQGYPREKAGYFTTCFREGWTTYGKDWLFFEGAGTGWFVGAVQSMLGEHYCEGDEHIYLDGAISPQINGTGSEDYYLGCFWPNREFNSPFANVVGDIQEEGDGTMAGAYHVPSCYTRFHLEAPIPFFNRIDARIQHGGLSTIRSRYGSLAFAYLRRTPTLVLTDFINVGIEGSEKAHGYEASAARLTGPVEARPEGSEMTAVFCGQGRVHEGGEIRFTVAVDPENQGVRLRRRLDQGVSRQRAEVFINGERVGVWYDPNHNEHLRWYDSDFDIHPKFTRGKKELEVKLAARSFTDFRYEAFSFIP